MSADKIARGIGTDVATVEKAAADMGLPLQRCTDEWEQLGYITTIRNAWHMLPYDKLLAVLGWSEDKRSSGDKEYLAHIVSEEKKIAQLMYGLMSKNSLFGYEAANHYYFNKAMLAEKFINSFYIAMVSCRIYCGTVL